MFRKIWNVWKAKPCFPRMRGDVPKKSSLIPPRLEFSPHARGCSPNPNSSRYTPHVFPACAGMFPIPEQMLYAKAGFPRMRGDVPDVPYGQQGKKQFSPHARGCSGQWRWLGAGQDVFPACAGMFPRGGGKRGQQARFPRMRGDVPHPIVACG